MTILAESRKKKLVRLIERDLETSLSGELKGWLIFQAETFLESWQAADIIKFRRELSGLQERLESFLISIGKIPFVRSEKRRKQLPPLVIHEALRNTLNFSYKPGHGLDVRDYLLDRCEQMVQELHERAKAFQERAQTKGGPPKQIGPYLDWAKDLVSLYTSIKKKKPSIRALEDLLSKSLRCIGPHLKEKSTFNISREALANIPPLR